jgi:hypothetical protein
MTEIEHEAGSIDGWSISLSEEREATVEDKDTFPER